MELAVSHWYNTDAPPTLAGLRGRVVVIEAFQMLCPGCVAHGLPQAQRVRQVFGDEVVVLGLHTVFEHHDAMTPTALEAFLHEYRIDLPVGVDRHQDGSPVPITMARLGLQGTPSMVLLDRSGAVRARHFGRHDDLALGAELARLLGDPTSSDPCDADSGCAVPMAEGVALR